ncbi:MAG: TonB-dependent receptor [Fermentimonas sp.]|jgi:outer membrane receptor for ferrienterochelin and colicins
MNKIISIIIAISFAISSYAQYEHKQASITDAHIFGHIIEKATQEHLPYATIKLKGTTIGITSDITGHYFLRNLPLGNYTLEVSMVGFKTITKEVLIEQNKTLEINFELEDENISLDAVVVTANRNETTRRMAPSLVSVVDMQTLNLTNSTTLADGLKFSPGLRVENNCQNCGSTQVRINGMEGTYSQIMIDSRPIIGALAGVYGLEHIPANMIERIEVIRGGGSALYGAKAIGGIINVITKDPIRNSGEISHTMSSINVSGSLENNTMFNSSLVNDTRSAGIMIYGQHKIRDGFDYDGDGFTELPKLKNRAFGFHSFLRTGLYSRLTLEYNNVHEFRRGGDRLNKQPFEAYITEMAENYINNGSINYVWRSHDQKNKINLYSAVSHVYRDSYYGAGEPLVIDLPPISSEPTQYQIDQTNADIQNNNTRLHSFGNNTELTYQIGGNYMRSIDKVIFMPANFTIGAEYSGGKLEDESIYRRDDPLSQKTRILSGFLQNEWKNNALSIILGGRLDKHNLIDNAIFSPRINLRYNPTKNVNLRLTYSEGFRAPEIFDEDLHVDLAGGEQFIREFDKDLKEERSHSLSGSIDLYHYFGKTNIANLLIEGFYTKLDRPFTNTRIGNIIKVHNAESGASVYGINIEARTLLLTNIDIQVGTTIQSSIYEKEKKWWEPETPEEEKLDKVEPTRRMMRTPNVYGYFVTSYKPTINILISLSGNYTGSMLIPHDAGTGTEGVDRFSKVNITEKSPTFFELNTKVAYTFNVHKDVQLEINAGIQNIFNSYQSDFDTGAGRSSTYIYGPGMPRTIFAGSKIIL